MAIGKNKGLSKGKKGNKKKGVDPFSKKDWYELKAPIVFNKTKIGKTCVNRTQGTRIASEELKGRVVEINMGDLQNDSNSFRKFKFVIHEVQGKDCLTNFYGMDITTDKYRSLIRKWQTTIEANVNVKTLDGYLLRFFCIGFTKRRANNFKKACYVNHTTVRNIRKLMVKNITEEISVSTIKEVMAKLIPDDIGQEIEKKAKIYHPLKDVLIRKVKVLKEPKLDTARLLDIHGQSTTTTVPANTVTVVPENA